MNKELYYTMELQGEGIVMVEPDVVIINLGVETINQDLKIAQAENARLTQAVILSIKRMGVNENDIQTASYDINKQYDYVDGKQVDLGYRVRNILRITLRNIPRTGEVVDTAVDHGANVVNGINFEVEDPSEYYQQALILALKDTQEKAMTMATQLRVQLYHVPLRIVEESYNLMSSGPTYLMKDRTAETPIEPGQMQIVAKIKAVFSYA